MHWTVDHWLNLGLFVAATLLVGLGSVKDWHSIMDSITPANVSGFGLAVLTFIRTMYTAKPRDPEVGTRRSDPEDTAPLVQVSPGVVRPVPPVTAGRPTEPQKD